MSWTNKRIVMIDTETTGLDPAEDRIVELAIAVGLDGRVIKTRSWLINPGMPIPEQATAVHGISDADVAEQPRFAEIVDEFLAECEGSVPAAYNAPFDRGFVFADLERAGTGVPEEMTTTWLDPLVWVREIQKYERGKKLTDACRRLGVKLDDAHRAWADAKAAMQVMYKLGAGSRRVPEDMAELLTTQERLRREHEESYRKWRARQQKQ